MLSWLAYWLVRLLSLTVRCRLEDESGLISVDSREVFLFAFWHNRLAMMPHLYWKYMRRRKMAALISASRDGEILARVLVRFHFTPVRGSSSRRGQAALLEMSRLVADGYDAGITPDGPRGPRYEVQSGIIDLGVLTGLKILPVSYVLSHKIELKSWDGFQIPLPFARCTVRVGKPITLARDADEATQETKRCELQSEMRRLSQESETGTA